MVAARSTISSGAQRWRKAIKWKESNRVKEGLQGGSKKRSEDGTVDLTNKLEVIDKRQSQ